MDFIGVFFIIITHTLKWREVRDSELQSKSAFVFGYAGKDGGL